MFVPLFSGCIIFTIIAIIVGIIVGGAFVIDSSEKDNRVLGLVAIALALAVSYSLIGVGLTVNEERDNELIKMGLMKFESDVKGNVKRVYITPPAPVTPKTEVEAEVTKGNSL